MANEVIKYLIGLISNTTDVRVRRDELKTKHEVLKTLDLKKVSPQTEVHDLALIQSELDCLRK